MLWFAWKFVPLWYQQQHLANEFTSIFCCDLLENSYLCGISNNKFIKTNDTKVLWFAWKFVPLWYQQQQTLILGQTQMVVICLKIRTFVVSATTVQLLAFNYSVLWFAWKFVPLWYQQQPKFKRTAFNVSCDLLENSYLCGISNNSLIKCLDIWVVVICLKIRTFVVSATTFSKGEKPTGCCDLLENSYLCGISNNYRLHF